MKKTFTGLLIIIAVLALFLSACERTASQAPVTKASATFELPFPAGTQGKEGPGKSATPFSIGSRTPLVMMTQKPLNPMTQTSIARGTPLPKNTPMAMKTSIQFTTPTKKATAIMEEGENPAPTVGVPSTYVVQPGEYPFCLARRFNVDAAELLRLNNLSASSLVSPGTKLQIPQNGAPYNSGAKARKPHPENYMVQGNDTIYSIACIYGDVDPASIISANNLSAPYILKPGQELYIP